MNTYETALRTAKAGIWYRATRTANPKGTILKLVKINGQTVQIKAYNQAVELAQAWARSTPKPQETTVIRAETITAESHYSAMTVKKLKTALQMKELPVSGNKAALVARLAA